MLFYMLNMLNIANYALCSDCVISDYAEKQCWHTVIGLAQPLPMIYNRSSFVDQTC